MLNLAYSSFDSLGSHKSNLVLGKITVKASMYEMINITNGPNTIKSYQYGFWKSFAKVVGASADKRTKIVGTTPTITLDFNSSADKFDNSS